MNNAVKYLHVRAIEKPSYNVSCFGGRTIAYVVDPVENVVRFAVAKVNSNDRYVRSIGNETAKKHLLDGNQSMSGVVTVNDIAKQCIHDVTREAIMKMNVTDFNWNVVAMAVRQVASKDGRFGNSRKFYF